jgi:hypothetical protein
MIECDTSNAVVGSSFQPAKTLFYKSIKWVWVSKNFLLNAQPITLQISFKPFGAQHIPGTRVNVINNLRQYILLQQCCEDKQNIEIEK